MAGRIQVFEYTSLRVGISYKGILFEDKHHKALIALNVLHKNKYFNVLHDGITFKHFVGVIQIENLVIEILPKIDGTLGGKAKWQSVLIEMLRVTKKLKIQKLEEADVKKQKVFLLDIYFEAYLKEIEFLLRQGLIKKYYQETSNVKALKGKLQFQLQVQHNLVHKERFYTTHQIYDKDHLVHQILYQALDIVSTLSKGKPLYNKCKSVALDFPEVKAVKATENTFKNLPKDKKVSSYKTAINIAKFIILNYAPDVSEGKQKMLSLLFDMNKLWEEYIFINLKKFESDYHVSVSGHDSTVFWDTISIRPDIVINDGTYNFIIDTKWKNISYAQPSATDLRQMYVYNDYWNSSKAMLLYPSNVSDISPNFICYEALEIGNRYHECAVGRISIFNSDSTLNESIGDVILNWFIDKPVDNK